MTGGLWGVSEVRRYVRAVVAGVVCAFVVLVANPLLPLTYVAGIALFVVGAMLALVGD